MIFFILSLYSIFAIFFIASQAVNTLANIKLIVKYDVFSVFIASFRLLNSLSRSQFGKLARIHFGLFEVKPRIWFAVQGKLQAFPQGFAAFVVF